MPEIAVFMDLEDESSILGYATQGEDRLFYVNEIQDELPKFDDIPSDKAMMGIVNKQVSKNKDANATSAQVDDDSRIWHSRLGQAKSIQSLKLLVRNGDLPHVTCT